MVFMLFCIQNDQIPKSGKIAKNAFFWKIRFFANSPQTIIDGQKMVKNGPKWPPKVFKTHFQPIFGVYTHSRPFFEKSKKIDFWKFFSDHASTKSAEFHFSGRKSAKYYWGSKKHISAPFRKISSSFIWGFPVSTIKNIYIDQFGQNPIFDT